MSRAARSVTRWIDEIEELTLVQVGRPARQWSWFQIAWAGLHAMALCMHLLSVLYHLRRVTCTDESEPRFVAGCPATHVRPPILLAGRRDEGTPRAHGAAG